MLIFTAEINIQTLAVIKGQLPKRILALTIEWALEHREELMEDWEMMRNDLQPKPIEPLV